MPAKQHESSPEPRPSNSSPDAPLDRIEDDLLGRDWFARDLLRLATETPPEWSVRIGIYGKWGSGKTSMMRFLEQLATADDLNHLVVPFNPWAYRDTDSLWHHFTSAVQTKLAEEAEEPSASGAARRAVSALFLLADQFGEASKAAQLASKAGGVSGLRAVLRMGPEDVARMTAELGGRRVIIMLDDVDRVDPTVLPGLLFSVKELLDLPGFTFVLALDPGVVGKALAEYHPGFGSGLQYLEKIIDFPRWLPPASRDGLSKLLARDIQRYCPFLPKELGEVAIDYCRPTPRSVRRFVRHLWSLKAEVERHGPNELKFELLALLELLKSEWPNLAAELLDSLDLDAIALDAALAQTGTAKSKETRKKVAALAKKHRLSAPDTQRAIGIVEALSARTPLILGKDIGYHAYLRERPHALTRLEFGELEATWREDQTDLQSVEAWIEAHTRRLGFSKTRVKVELFEFALVHRNHLIELSMDEPRPARALEHRRGAEALLKLLEALLSAWRPFAGPDPALNVSHFQQMLDTFWRYWAIRGDEWNDSQRAAEQSLLVAAAKQQSENPFELSRALDALPSGLGPAGWGSLREILRAEIEPMKVDMILAVMAQEGGLRILHRSTWRPDVLRFTLSGASALYRERRGEFLEALRADETGKTAAAQDTAIELLLVFGWWLKDRSSVVPSEEAIMLLDDREILEAIWAAAVAHELGLRWTHVLDEARKRIWSRDQPSPPTLPLPSWWALPVPEADGTPRDEGDPVD